MDGASGLRAQSCSTESARLCTITTVSIGGGGESRVSAKRRASPLPPLLVKSPPSYPFSKEFDKSEGGSFCPQMSAEVAELGRIIKAGMKLFPCAGMIREGLESPIQFMA